MSHLTHELLWAYARRELELEERAAVEAHLSLCHGCTLWLDEVRAAQALLSALPEPPPMPEALARRVGAALADEAEKRFTRRTWWPFDVSPLWVLAGAAATAAVLTGWVATREAVPSPAPTLAQQDEPVQPEPVVLPPPPAPPARPAKKLTASVASAKRARSGAGALAKAQTLAEGSRVSTESGGALWLNLPDGTRAGLTSASEVQLARLEEKTLTLEVAKGSLALVVPHRQDRLLTVRAGEVVVRDLGTRFLVSRDVSRVLVAVEEGSVEVTLPSRTERVSAGHAVAWQNGQYQAIPWEVSPPRAPVRRAPPVPEGGSSASRLSGDDDEADALPPPPAQQPVAQRAQAPETPVGAAQEDPSGSPEDEWASLPGEPPLHAAPPAVASGTPNRPVELPKAQGADRPAEPAFSLRDLERKLQDLTRALHLPVVVTMSDPREQHAKEIDRLADAGECATAVQRADQWLADPPGNDEFRLRKGVLKTKLGCLTKLGRIGEATEVQRLLNAMP